MRNPSSTSTKSSSPSKTTPCCTKLGLKRGPWTPEEDDLLSTYIHREGEGRWRTLPKRAGLLRCGKSCRLRWMNYLRPSVKRGQISPDEEDLILRLHRLLGNRWSLIAGRIPGRTDNEIKNYWNTHLSKKLISQGIDPRTHKPLNPADRQQPQQQTAVHELKGNSSSSSSKANRKTSSSTSVPKPPPPAGNTVSLGALGKEETNNTSGSNIQVINNKVNNSNNEYVQNTTTTATTSQYPTAAYTSGLLNCDGSLGGMDMIRSNIEEDKDLNYCTDDIFSSFLDSLINEDPFTTQQHQLFLQHQHQHPNGNIAITIPHDPNHLVSSLGFGTAWESTLMPSDTNDHKRVDDH